MGEPAHQAIGSSKSVASPTPAAPSPKPSDNPMGAIGDARVPATIVAITRVGNKTRLTLRFEASYHVGTDASGYVIGVASSGFNVVEVRGRDTAIAETFSVLPPDMLQGNKRVIINPLDGPPTTPRVSGRLKGRIVGKTTSATLQEHGGTPYRILIALGRTHGVTESMVGRLASTPDGAERVNMTFKLDSISDAVCTAVVNLTAGEIDTHRFVELAEK